MENIILNTSQIDLIELVSYLSIEIFYLFGIVLNLIVFFTLKKRSESKRLSDFITNGIFILNSLTAIGILVKNYFSIGQINFSLLNGLFVFDNKAIFLQFIINIFLLLYLMVSYKITRKARFKTPLINSILLFCGFIASVITLTQGSWQLYILLSILCYSIYRYSSSSRIRKDDFFSADFLLINICADLLFAIFYGVSNLIQNLAQQNLLQANMSQTNVLQIYLTYITQLDIIQVCITCSILLKLGIFPIYNYTICTKYKSNIPFSILLFVFYPLIGIIALEKIIQNILLTNEIHQLTIAIFLCITILFCSFNAYKTKNITKFIASMSYCIFGFIIMGYIFTGNSNLKLAIFFTFALLGIFSLVEIVKININPEKINTSCLRGIFYNNRFFAILFIIFLLILCSIFPNAISKLNLEIIKLIYLSDKTGIYFISSIFLANTLVLLNSFKIAQNIFDFDNKVPKIKLTKRTTVNYVVPVVTIIILIINLFL